MLYHQKSFAQVNFFAVNDVIGLLPELDFGQFAVVPAVADDAVRVGCGASQVGGLRGAGDGGERGFNARFIAARGKLANARRVLADERVREADDIDDGGASQWISP